MLILSHAHAVYIHYRLLLTVLLYNFFNMFCKDNDNMIKVIRCYCLMSHYLHFHILMFVRYKIVCLSYLLPM